MTAIGRHGGMTALFGHRTRGSGSGPGPALPRNLGLIWRLVAIALIPLAVWLATAALYDRIPQTAGGLHYDVVVNRLTGSACIDVKNEPMPEALADLACD